MQLFIDGVFGTTGLQIRERLSAESGIRLIGIDESLRKNKDARAECLNEADISILCLPDEAAREAARLVKNPKARLLDASAAHRTKPEWIYGMPEWSQNHRQTIAKARRVSNPGCYAIAAIALIRPLMEKGIMPRDHPVFLTGVSGYTGGGAGMISRYENESDPDFTRSPVQAYALNLNHKHVEEIRLHGGLTSAPLFTPFVGRYRQGMIVEMPLHLKALKGSPRAEDLHDALAAFYDGEEKIAVMPFEANARPDRLDADSFQGRDDMEIHIFSHEPRGHALLCAILDNLGKGAAGNAMQNIRLMLA